MKFVQAVTPVATLSGPSELFVLGNGISGMVLDLDRPGSIGSTPHAIGLPGLLAQLLADPLVLALVLALALALAIDVDADGRHEVLIFDIRPGAAGGSDELVVFQVEDEVDAFATGDVLGAWPGATRLAGVGRDLEGDGVDEVFLVALAGAEVQYRMYDPATTTLGPVTALATFPGIPEPVFAFSVAAGQVDPDPQEEIALIIAAAGVTSL